MLQLFVLFSLVAAALASYGNNLNYRSPSLNHPGLGISVRKVVKRHDPRSAFAAGSLNFTHGVASGDPAPNSVILWTRCAPSTDDVQNNSTTSGFVPLYNPVPVYNDTDEGKPVSNTPVCLKWKIASDKGLSSVLDSGTVYTSSDVDYTVKVEAGKLQPFTSYYYQFSICNTNQSSVVGRTKTIPNPNDDTSQVNLAIYSCSNFPFGFFNAFGNPVRKDSVDYVIHLGDYIYEYENGAYGWGQSIDRVPLPDRTIFTLYDYRKRYATYRTDLDLLANHQQFPWIPVWDDHGRSIHLYAIGHEAYKNRGCRQHLPRRRGRPQQHRSLLRRRRRSVGGPEKDECRASLFRMDAHPSSRHG
jgi:alkaline phosphatase D